MHLAAARGMLCGTDADARRFVLTYAMLTYAMRMLTYAMRMLTYAMRMLTYAMRHGCRCTATRASMRMLTYAMRMLCVC
jgi:hypothetical protein